MATAKHDPENLQPSCDFKYRTLVAFLPGAGVFYCARERRPVAVGRKGSLVPHDVSWLRIGENTKASHTAHRFSFGADGYIQRFADERRDGLPMSRWCSAWRITYGTKYSVPRMVLMAKQCSDSDGPCMPPDIIVGEDVGTWPAAYRAREYNSRLVASKAAKVGGRHYAKACLHSQLPEDCLIVGGRDTPQVDVVVEIAAHQSFRARRTTVRVRNLLSESDDATFFSYVGWNFPMLVHELRTIALHNKILRRKLAKGSARNSNGDIGEMHPLGTRIMPNGITKSTYSATYKASHQLVGAYVNALSRVGQVLFPDVLAVIQDTEEDTGMVPSPRMAGDGAGNRVGYSIDTSVDLANASHYDVNDASQGYSVWTEDLPGTADNWYFVMPNVYGTVPAPPGVDGRQMFRHFRGMAVQLRHGTAISWDGRLIRHCSSLLRPNGPVENPQVNHAYGTFTAAKERIVEAGRKRAALLQNDGGGEEIVFTDDDERDNPPVDPTKRPLPMSTTTAGKRARHELHESLRGNCGKDFFRNHKIQRFCCEDCRKEAWKNKTGKDFDLTVKNKERKKK